MSTTQIVAAWVVSILAGITCTLLCLAFLGILFPWLDKFFHLR